MLEGGVIQILLGGKEALDVGSLGELDELGKETVKIFKVSLGIHCARALISGVIIGENGVKGLVKGGPVDVIGRAGPGCG